MSKLSDTQAGYLRNLGRSREPHADGKVSVEYIPSPTRDALIEKGYLEPLTVRETPIIRREWTSTLTQKAIDEGFGSR